MKYLSVCSGIEAATVAWKPLGFEPAGVSEIEPFPNGILDHHYPEVTNLGDMTNYKEWKIERPEIIVGGTPCQSFSVAGLRQGMDDPRGNLTLVFLGVVAHFRPTWVVWENVPGVLSIHKGRPFGSFLGGLAELGYGWAYRVLDAQYFGVPQKRRRVFVVGHSSGQFHRAAALLFERESLRRNPAPSREKGEEVAGSLTSRTRGGGFPGTDEACGGYVQAIADPITESFAKHHGASGGKDCIPRNHIVVMAHGQGGSEIMEDKSPSLTCNHEAPICFDTTQITSDKNYSNPKPGNVCHPLAESSHVPTIAFMAGQGAKAGSVAASEEVSPTLKSGDSGTNRTPSIVQYATVRRLTEIECERLQGFPDNYTQIPWKGKAPADCPMGPRYKALGNAMNVEVMRWIGERIKTTT